MPGTSTTLDQTGARHDAPPAYANGGFLFRKPGMSAEVKNSLGPDRCHHELVLYQSDEGGKGARG